MKFFAERAPWNQGVEVRIIGESTAIKTICSGEIIFKEIEEGAYTEPAMKLKYNEAQELMDELWHCGLRPSEGSGSAGSLAATQKHLEDMRALVFQDLSKIRTICKEDKS